MITVTMMWVRIDEDCLIPYKSDNIYYHTVQYDIKEVSVLILRYGSCYSSPQLSVVAYILFVVISWNVALIVDVVELSLLHTADII